MPSPDIVDGIALASLAGKLAPVLQAGGAGGNVSVKTGAGAPGTGVRPAQKGSLYIDTTNAIIYICTVATGTYVTVGSQT